MTAATATTRRRTQGGEVILTVTITGEHDIFRWAFTLLHQQVEFMTLGAAVLATQRARMGATAWDALDTRLTGGRAKPYATRTRGGAR